MKPLVRRLAAIGLAILAPAAAHGTGYYGPTYYLEEGGKNVAASPEFYWELEVKRLARDFQPSEKLVARPAPEPQDGGAEGVETKPSPTNAADLADFAEALREKTVQPPNAEEAARQHEAARDAIDGTAPDKETTLPEEFPSEFADYHRGAFAFRRGKEHWEEARQAWTALLARPAEERRYRTVWATFMLGKLALKNLDPEAAKWFQQTRALAKEGWKDSLGMAADSYGWEGRSAWKAGHPEKAAPLFLTQLAMGDESAVISLKALIPDRVPIDGMLNYGPEADERSTWNEEQKRAAEEKAERELKVAAQDPLLRRLVTSHILATSAGNIYFDETRAVGTERAKRWLAVIDAARLGTIEDAEYLGWAAYQVGDYRAAGRWLGLAKKDSPAALWLTAKLQRRAGKLSDAAQSMAQAWASVREVSRYTGWTKTGTIGDQWNEEPGWSFPDSASGDLAGLHLARADFVQALDTFLKGGLWHDAAFVAERVLTANELKTYVEQLPAASPPKQPPGEESPAAETAQDWTTGNLRYLLGRRLVREGRAEEAKRYLPAPNDRLLGLYLEALQRGGDEKQPKLARAEALFQAAWLARYDGMELMGAEGAPDAFISGGSFEIEDLAAERLRGSYEKVDYTPEGEKKSTVPIALKPTSQERARLGQNKITPDIRFHYRVIAAALAMKAAKLLPDNTEELADVINTAGWWVRDRDKPAAERYYNTLERRCAKTELGRTVIGRRWFVEERGPWSEKQEAAREALQKELNPETGAEGN